jgi:hypothetical protein
MSITMLFRPSFLSLMRNGPLSPLSLDLSIDYLIKMYLLNNECIFQEYLPEKGSQRSLMYCLDSNRCLLEQLKNRNKFQGIRILVEA